MFEEPRAQGPKGTPLEGSGPLRIAIGMLVVACVAFVGVTWWALESGGVAILSTRSSDGSKRTTHVWFAEPDGVIWLEAGTPENGWYLDVQEDPVVSFSSASSESSESSESIRGGFAARPIAGSEAHDKIRGLLREKYGIRDWWIGVLFDTSRSIAVELAPL